jgi:hypothetical protein
MKLPSQSSALDSKDSLSTAQQVAEAAKTNAIFTITRRERKKAIIGLPNGSDPPCGAPA